MIAASQSTAASAAVAASFEPASTVTEEPPVQMCKIVDVPAMPAAEQVSPAAHPCVVLPTSQ